MASRKAHRLITVACVGTLAALGLMTWQLFAPAVFPVIVAMSLGQVLGTLSFASFLYVVAMDLRRRRGDVRRGERATQIVRGGAKEEGAGCHRRG